MTAYQCHPQINSHFMWKKDSLIDESLFLAQKNRDGFRIQTINSMFLLVFVKLIYSIDNRFPCFCCRNGCCRVFQSLGD